MRIEASDVIVALLLACTAVLVALGKLESESFSDATIGVFGYVARGVATALGAKKP